MSKKLLIATLGTSPAVITEAIDLLIEQHLKPDGVIILMTDDVDVKASYNLLARHLASYYNIKWFEQILVADYGDISNSVEATEFMQEACRVLKTYRDAGYDLFVSIAGGRKVMSALLTLAVQFYGAKKLFHVWVPPLIEADGEIDKVKRWEEIPDKLNEVLHPSLSKSSDDHPHLVEIPFIGLFPLLPDILVALKADATAPSPQIRELLKTNGLISSEGKITELGQNVHKILEGVESLPPARQGECNIHIPPHHHNKKLGEFANRLCDHFTFITEIISTAFSQGENQVKIKAPNQLQVNVSLGKDVRLGLQLTTTAKSEGQLEATRQAIERFMKSTLR